jgi:hypothetical protein
LLLGAAAVTTSGCAALAKGGPEGRFAAAEPAWTDPDTNPIAQRPAEYFSPFAWDAANQTVFYPISRALRVEDPGESVNVNALDEVPDSSWFTNRIGRALLSPEELARGPCDGASLNPEGPWTVTGAKPNGANPGFLIKAADGRRYLLKFDGVVTGPRATSADVLVSKLYYAAGYFGPCNEVLFFDRNILRIAPDAEGQNAQGKDEPLTHSHLDQVFAKAIRLADGRYRASASLFIEGKPLGPWTYQGRRRDDPNDVIDHEDRRELRGGKVLAAWVNHFDAREQNTMASWIPAPDGGGHVRHWYLDFGDCLGAIWEPPMLGRRLGHAFYFDPPQVAADFLTFGVIERPWDRARFGPSGRVFGYYRVEDFDPDRYRNGYPNPAFARATERDAAWMARILARFTDADLRAVIGTAKLNDAFLEAEALRLLRGRLNRILERYLGRLSPLTAPRLFEDKRAGGSLRLCARDAALEGGIVQARERVYGARAFSSPNTAVELAAPAWFSPPDRPGTAAPAEVCWSLPRLTTDYAVVDLHAGRAPGTLGPPARVHLTQVKGAFTVVGLERLERAKRPRF